MVDIRQAFAKILDAVHEYDKSLPTQSNVGVFGCCIREDVCNHDPSHESARADVVESLKTQMLDIFISPNMRHLEVTEKLEACANVAAKVLNDAWEKALRDGGYAEVFIAPIRSRVHPPAKPKTAEEAAYMKIRYRPTTQGVTFDVCGLCGAVVGDDLAHTGWHNNLTLGLQTYGNKTYQLGSVELAAVREADKQATR